MATVKQEKSVVSVVTTHIITTSIVMPFFGLLAGYVVTKFFGTSLNDGLLMIMRDIVYILFFLIGVHYSLLYINKNIVVKNPQRSAKFSIIVFGILITAVWSINVFAGLNSIGVVYNTLFFVIIFAIFFRVTKRFFENLKHEVATVSVS
ncbi:MAG TPA: hypothetical protein ENK65_01010 [Helicobacteraceae bacterium]|nr:hypothetical protein [Helicobacteraceae bacterium]